MFWRPKGLIDALQSWADSPFRSRPHNDVETLEWAIALLEKHDGVQANPNSRYWLERLRALAHHAKLDRVAAPAPAEGEKR